MHFISYTEHKYHKNIRGADKEVFISEIISQLKTRIHYLATFEFSQDELDCSNDFKWNEDYYKRQLKTNKKK